MKKPCPYGKKCTWGKHCRYLHESKDVAMTIETRSYISDKEKANLSIDSNDMKQKDDGEKNEVIFIDNCLMPEVVIPVFMENTIVPNSSIIIEPQPSTSKILSPPKGLRSIPGIAKKNLKSCLKRKNPIPPSGVPDKQIKKWVSISAPDAHLKAPNILWSPVPTKATLTYDTFSQTEISTVKEICTTTSRLIIFHKNYKMFCNEHSSCLMYFYFFNFLYMLIFLYFFIYAFMTQLYNF